MSSQVVIRHCHALEEFHACVALQREIWKEEPLEVEPATMFIVATHTGGQVLGAFDGDRLVGFTLAVAAIEDSQLYLHSHMTGIKDGYRDQGIGRQLKFFQREEALRRGIAIIRWTFDPLEVRNAHFNLNRLGATCRKYLSNLYGVTTSPLHRGVRTDRLLAEWRLKDSRVVAATTTTAAAAATIVPEEMVETVGGSTDAVRIAVPHALPYGLSGNIAAVTALQDYLRDEFTAWFAKGYHATAVTTGDAPAYLLMPPRT
jgi:predicted GNAT superfamily acetyltransferase